LVLSAKDAATVLGISPRTLRARIKRGDVRGYKRGGRWFVRRADLPLDAATHHALVEKAEEVRAAVEAALPAAAGGRGGGATHSLSDNGIFVSGQALYERLPTGRARAALRTALLHVAEAHSHFRPSEKRAALVCGRAAFARAAAHARLDGLAPDITDALEGELLPRVGGLMRWVESLGRKRKA